ncbi:hypothetical protein GGF32_004581 [Allomyces javanicus]|nr:hypothetical protein GGF32_004581 [Allomyces javanicus]
MAQYTTAITLLAAALALLVLAAGPAHAVLDLRLKWSKYYLSAVGAITDTFQLAGLNSTGACLIVTDITCPGQQYQATINGQDKGVTSVPGQITSCPPNSVSRPDAALLRPEFTRGFFPLQAGTSSVVLKMVMGPPEFAYLGAFAGPCVDPLGPQDKVVTTAGKVRTRAAAKAACEAQGRVLAAVTSSNST